MPSKPSLVSFRSSSNDEVRVPDSETLDFNDAFILEAWVNPHTLTELVPVLAKSLGLASGYGLAPSVSGKPAGFVSSLGTLKAAFALGALKVGEWTHLGFTSDGTTLRLYVNGSLAASSPAIKGAPTTADLIIGGPALNAPTVSTWDIFTQWRLDTNVACEPALSPPIAYGVRSYKAGAHTNPGETQTSTPVDGEYLELRFSGGEITTDCEDIVKPTETYVLGLLQHNHWYDFVQHTRWTPEGGGPGNSVTEIWMEGTQILGNQSHPVSTPSLYWHGSLDNHTDISYPQFGIYRGPSEEDPESRYYIDAIRSGNSYADVAPRP